MNKKSFSFLVPGFWLILGARSARFFKLETRNQKLETIYVAIIVSLFALLSGNCLAENLPDPTRPPIDAKGELLPTSDFRSGPVLQTILISPKRRAAIINGQMVALGEKYGEAKVIEINESYIVLKKGEGTETLRLFPNVTKRIRRAE